MGLKLAPGSRRRTFEEQYLVYLALTRSAEKLYLTYPLADSEGRAVMPSGVVARVKELLPDVEERVWPVEPNATLADDLTFVSNPGRALSYLAAQLREARAGRPVDPCGTTFTTGLSRAAAGRNAPGYLPGASSATGRAACPPAWAGPSMAAPSKPAYPPWRSSAPVPSLISWPTVWACSSGRFTGWARQTWAGSFMPP